MEAMAEEPGQDGVVEEEQEEAAEGPQASGVLGSSTPASQVLAWPALVCGQHLASPSVWPAPGQP